MLAQAVEDGISSNLDAADLFFLIAVILFVIAFVVRLFYRPAQPAPISIDGVIIAAGFACTALGLFLL